jgi:hypothetical protein
MSEQEDDGDFLCWRWKCAILRFVIDTFCRLVAFLLVLSPVGFRITEVFCLSNSVYQGSWKWSKLAHTKHVFLSPLTRANQVLLDGVTKTSV